MNQTVTSHLTNHLVGSGQAQKFIDSGENLTQERFTKSRQRKHRLNGRGNVVVPPFPSNTNSSTVAGTSNMVNYLRQSSLSKQGALVAVNGGGKKEVKIGKNRN